MTSAAGAPVLEAVIEEARRRARARRLYVGAAAGLVLVVAAGIVLLIFLWPGGGASQSRELTVEHAIVESSSRYPTRIIDLRTGAVAAVPVISEMWWDRRRGLARVIERVDGRVRSDLTGQMCGVGLVSRGKKRRWCEPPAPFLFEEDRSTSGLRRARPTGRGTFRGRPLVWVRGFYGEPVALDAATRRPRLMRIRTQDGTLVFQSVFTFLKPVRGAAAKSVVRGDPSPRRHGPFSSMPRQPRADVTKTVVPLQSARRALGATALWVGPSFRGHRLRGVEVGTAKIRGRHARTVKFVRLDYGIVLLKEYGRVHPPSYEQGPRAGRAVLEGRWQAAVQRDRVLVIMTRRWGRYLLTPRRVLDLARALRPIPARR